MLIEEARPTERVQLGVDRFPRSLKRALGMLAANEGVTLREIVLRGLAREVLQHPEASGLEHADSVASPDN